MLPGKPCRRLIASATIAMLVAACGGGGGAGTDTTPTVQGPPAAAAELALSADEASEGVAAAIAGGSALAEQDRGPESVFLPTGDPFAARAGAGSAAVPFYAQVAGSPRERALATASLACTDLFPAPCSGSLTLDTNLSQNGSNTIPAGAYLSFSFDALQGTSDAGKAVDISGTLRIEFLTAVNLLAAEPANVQFQLTTLGLAGSVDGRPFGPKTAAALVAFDAQGAPTITTAGRRFSQLGGIAVTDADHYVIGSATVRSAHWRSPTGYVDTTFTDWNVVGGRPMPGSLVTVTGGGGGTLAIAVTASSNDVVVYDVQLDAGGVSKRYTVTATYAPGGSRPTYVTIEVLA